MIQEISSKWIWNIIRIGLWMEVEGGKTLKFEYKITTVWNF